MADKNGTMATAAKVAAVILLAVSITINVSMGVSAADADRDHGDIAENTKAIYGLQIQLEYLHVEIERLNAQITEALAIYRGG